MRLVARVPATVANLGPGFDCFGLALELCNEVTIDTDARPGVSWEGEGADELPTDGTDMVSRAMRHVAGSARRELPPFGLHSVNRIPLERGLGSSAAAAVAGIGLAYVLLDLPDEPDPYTTFSLASELEGHPDNAAAAVYGGLTLAADDVRPLRLDPHPSLRPAVLIAEGLRLSTDEARRVLAPQVARADAVFNLGRAAMAVVALTERPDLLGPALEDRLHQDVRLSLLPEVREMFERVRAVGVPVCVCGAGPSLLAFESGSRAVPDPGPGWRVLRIAPRAAGVEVERA